ncbi:unnamed protein product [Dibothriocephalus latus]|uniref:Uncharacterized protein n=1 Tax=Dibothriocephalus latus TaxID=60516 RepID=A0A3P7LY61_DIBLA|nr:unnamed protein product [Dibothriocephalus latus]
MHNFLPNSSFVVYICQDSQLPPPFPLSAEESSLSDPQTQLMANKRRPARRSAPSSTAHQFQSKPAFDAPKLRRPKSSFGSNPILPSNPQPGARLSLLLSINEDSELVLVPQPCQPPDDSSVVLPT